MKKPQSPLVRRMNALGCCVRTARMWNDRADGVWTEARTAG